MVYPLKSECIDIFGLANKSVNGCASCSENLLLSFIFYLLYIHYTYIIQFQVYDFENYIYPNLYTYTYIHKYLYLFIACRIHDVPKKEQILTLTSSAYSGLCRGLALIFRGSLPKKPVIPKKPFA